MSTRDVERVNAINVALMLLSLAVAWVVPFELFLFAYAVLGPLRYLTEISWLHDRGYFTTGRRDVLALLALGALAFVARYTGLIGWDGWVVLAFGLAAAFALASGVPARAALATAALAATLVIGRWGAAWLFLVVMLPTVIHVFCFTGLFILHGSVKSRSARGYASLAVFLACGAGLLLYHPPAAHYAVAASTPPLVEEFSPVIDQLGLLAGPPQRWDNLVSIGRFLAFAYTYHCLNWFSKTGIIRWHTVSRRRMAAIAIGSAAAVAVYVVDYHVGIVALFFLSLVHVLLEFPLDLRTAAALVSGRVARA